MSEGVRLYEGTQAGR